MASSDSNRSESPLPLPESTSPAVPVPQPLTPALPSVSSPSAYGAIVPASPLPPGLAAPPDMKALIKALKRHWLLATTLGLVAATAASSAAWYFMPLKYSAEIMLNVNTTRLIPVDNEGASPFSSMTLATLPKARYIVSKALAEPRVAQLTIVREQIDPVEWLRRGLEVTFVSPELMTIKLTGYNPAEQVILVDAVAKVYEQELGDAERQIRQVRVKKLDSIISGLQAVVKRKKVALQNYIKNIGAANPGQRQNQADYDRRRRDRLIDEKVQQQSTLNKLLALQAQGAEQKKEGTIYIPQSQINKELEENSELQELNRKLDRMEKDLVEREGSFRDKNHPRLRDAREEIEKTKAKRDALKKKLAPEIRKHLIEKKGIIGDENAEANKEEIAALKLYINVIDEEIDKLTKRIEQEGPQSFELEDMKSDFDAEERVMDSLRLYQAKLNAEAQQAQASVRIPENQSAVAAAQQDTKKQIMIAGGSGVAALALVLFAIAYWEFRVRRINTAEDVVYGLGWRLVGQLPPLPERSRGGLLRRPVDPHYWQNLMTESVDATRTMILHAARVEGLRTVMVTSAVSGEGKTSLSCHLACSLARAGRKTLLLDCDLRNPAAHRLFELPAEPGLCEVLRGEAELAEVIRATPANNLWLIPAGQFDEQALQMFTLSQSAFAPLLEQLKTQFDFIVIDSSPVLPVVDTLVIGQNVDVVVFSLLRDVSRIPSVYAAYQRLATLGIRILGAVVNGVDTGSYGYSSTYSKQAV